MCFGKGMAAGAAALLGLALVAAPPADAAYIAYLYQDGANVVAIGSGSVDQSALTYENSGIASGEIDPAGGLITLGGGSGNGYGPFTAAPEFGSGGDALATSSSGNLVGFATTGDALATPSGYVSGTSLGVSTATWDNTTLAALGVTDGTYTWSWSTNSGADSFTLYIGRSPVPEPGSVVLLATAVAALGLSGRQSDRAG